jgi:LacI family transcriptional regulator
MLVTPKKATTLRDIARELGVSTMTVSAALNGGQSRTRVSDRTRERVVEAAARLRYLPNGVARGLSRRRMDTIGVVAEVQGQDVNLYFLDLIGGIIEAATEYGQNTTIFSITGWEKDQRRMLQFCDGRVDGMILLAPSNIAEPIAEAIRHQAQFVMIHCETGPLHVDNVDVDNEACAFAMVSYLIGLGHKRIAFFSGQKALTAQCRRTHGYRRALAEAGIPFDESLLVSGWYSTGSGRERAAQLLGRQSTHPLPTAIFCGNDAIAAGCMEVLAANGVRIPEDVSVTGFDGLLLSSMTVPPLTTIQQPLRKMGRYAVERLLFRIREGAEYVAGSQVHRDRLGAAGIADAGQTPLLIPPHTEVFPCDLIVRGSSSPPRRTNELPARL